MEDRDLLNKRILITRKDGSVRECEIMYDRGTGSYAYVNLTTHHVCACRFQTAEEAVQDLCKNDSVESYRLKEESQGGSRVDHPTHYNQHPLGIECIDIIRHYTCDVANAIKYLWRAGLKQEMGVQERMKEIEDLKKAIWYIEDLAKHEVPGTPSGVGEMWTLIKEVTGHSVKDITSCYEPHIAAAMATLLSYGLVSNGNIYFANFARADLSVSVLCIQERIAELESENKQIL